MSSMFSWTCSGRQFPSSLNSPPFFGTLYVVFIMYEQCSSCTIHTWFHILFSHMSFPYPQSQQLLLIFGLTEGGKLRAGSWRVLGKPSQAGLTLSPLKVRGGSTRQQEGQYFHTECPIPPPPPAHPPPLTRRCIRDAPSLPAPPLPLTHRRIRDAPSLLLPLPIPHH